MGYEVRVEWDWIKRKHYWINEITKTMEVMDIFSGGGKDRKVLVKFGDSTSSGPRDITLDPVRR